MASKACRLKILHAKQIVTVVNDGRRYLTGKAADAVAVIEDGGMVVGSDGNILMVGPSAEVEAASASMTADTFVDGTAQDLCVLPGFVDAHTHPVWAGDRCHEFHIKLAGATYTEVAAMGGGIGFTTRHTKAASEDDLLRSLEERIDRMTRLGTTTVEAKSGYGLETETEMKMLRVIHRAKATRVAQAQHAAILK